MRKVLLLIIYFYALAMGSCSSLQSTTPFSISLSKEACKGRCPVYKVSISGNGIMEFEGIENTTYQGHTAVTISASELKKIKSLLRKIDFTQLDKAYDERHYDLPLTTIKTADHSVSFKRSQSVPDELLLLVRQLDNLMNQHKLL